MRALVTGISGQLGGYLATELRKRSYEVFGIMRGQENPKMPEVSKRLPFVKLLEGDLLDYKSLIDAIATVNPAHIYNLGAISFVPISWKQPELVFQVNALGLLRILEAVMRLNKDIKVYQASTSEMYGRVPPPQNEETNMIPQSPYAVAKLAAHRFCEVYRKSFGLKVYTGICFNSESPERPDIFVTRKITKAAARISLGLQKELVLGNLDARRDWQYAGDAVKGMVDMMERAEPGDYVIATGISHSVREFADIAFSSVGLNYLAYVRTSAEYVRPADVNELRGDSSKLREATGWSPSVCFRELVEMMVKHDLLLSKNRHL